MCYSKALKADKFTIEAHYNATMRDLDYAPKYYENGFDFEYDPIITAERPKEFLMYRWGLVPWFESDMVKVSKPAGTLNCKSENMFETNSFREVARQGKRCLIPATSFRESHWSSVTKAKPKNKIPFNIFSKTQEVFSIAGLYSYWKDKQTGQELLTYTVLTTAANGLMKYIHNNPANPHRMPVILPKEFEKDWLNPNLTESDVLALCKCMPEDFLDSYPLSKDVNNAKIASAERDNPDFFERVDYAPDEIDEAEEVETAKAKDVKAKAAKKKGKADNGQGSLF